jgi:hypothetical protein
MNIKKFNEHSENNFEGYYIIGYGLSGGFGGIQNYEVIEDYTLESASTEAYQKACEEYDSYEGMYGLRTVDEIMEEDGIEDYEEAEEVWREERESWLDYVAFPFTIEKANELSGKYHFNNDYKEEMGL